MHLYRGKLTKFGVLFWQIKRCSLSSFFGWCLVYLIAFRGSGWFKPMFGEGVKEWDSVDAPLAVAALSVLWNAVFDEPVKMVVSDVL